MDHFTWNGPFYISASFSNILYIASQRSCEAMFNISGKSIENVAEM